MTPQIHRDAAARYVAPALFLVAVTILVLLVKSGLQGDDQSPSTTVPVSTAAASTSATATTPQRQPAAQPRKQFYVIESGDTFGTVAARFNTSIEALQALNPEVNSNSLSIGQRIRVK